MTRHPRLSLAISALLLAPYPLPARDLAQSFNIPAQSLGSALNLYAEQTGTQLSYPAALTSGLKSRPVTGRHTPAQALKLLLTDTGMVPEATRNGTLTLAKAETPAPAQSVPDSIELPKIIVSDVADTDPDANSYRKSYAVPQSMAGTKTDTPVLETPFSIQAVPQQVLKDQQAITFQDAVKNVAGVQSSPSQFYDQFLIRGFDSGYGATYRDMLKLEGITQSVDMAFVERIEVIKGPTAMLFGRIEPGGLINVVTKKPLPVAHYSLQQQFGSWDLYRTTGDATGPLTEDGTLLYRLKGSYDTAGSWLDFQARDNWALAGDLTWKPNDRFVANLSVEHYDQRRGDRGAAGAVPHVGNRPLKLPRNYSPSDPIMFTQFPDTMERTLVAFDWTYAFSDTWKLTQRFHWSNSFENQVNFAVYPGYDAATHLQKRAWIYNPVDRDIFATNINLQGEFNTGFMKHKMLFGFDLYQYEDHWRGHIGETALIPPLDVYNPVYGQIDVAALRQLTKSFMGNFVWHSRGDDYGVYIQDQASIDDHWFLLFGGRYAWATDRYADCYASCGNNYPYKLTAYPDQAFTPRGGILYKFDNQYSVYASYSESFGTNNGVTATGKRIDPQTGVQYEVGAKASLFEDRLSATLSFFELYKRNLLTPDPSDPTGTRSIPIGEARSRGVELSVSGQVTENINLIGNYTYDDVIITKDNTGNQGHRLNSAPEHSGSMWATYDTAPREHAGWTFGTGVFWRTEVQGDDANSFQLPGYARVDALLAYRDKLAGVPLSAQLNIQNLGDATYFERTNNNYSFYGAPRTFMGSLRVEF